MTGRFVSAKRLIRYFSNSSKLVEHRAQSPVRDVKMLAVWPSITEGFPTAKISRTGLWARCSTSLLEFEKYLMSLLAETKRRVIPATKFKFFTSTCQFFIVINSSCVNTKYLLQANGKLTSDQAKLFLDNKRCQSFVKEQIFCFLVNYGHAYPQRLQLTLKIMLNFL